METYDVKGLPEGLEAGQKFRLIKDVSFQDRVFTAGTLATFTRYFLVGAEGTFFRLAGFLIGDELKERNLNEKDIEPA